MLYTRPFPNAQAAARGNSNELRRALLLINTRLGSLETRAGGGSISLKDSSPVSAAPPLAQVAASVNEGQFVLEITNPQYKNVKRGNFPNTPLLHRVRFSSSSDFRNATTLPISGQTYWQVNKFGSGARKWIRVDSTKDGKTFNQHQTFGPLTA